MPEGNPRWGTDERGAGLPPLAAVETGAPEADAHADGVVDGANRSAK